MVNAPLLLAPQGRTGLSATAVRYGSQYSRLRKWLAEERMATVHSISRDNAPRGVAAHRAKKRWVNVAMKVIAMSRPRMARYGRQLLTAATSLNAQGLVIDD